MKNIILLFPFLVPAFLFAQYPTGSNKSRLGWQTTGDGLIWRGVAGDTVNKPNNNKYAYFQLDTVSGVLRRYIATRGKWQTVGGSGTNKLNDLIDVDTAGIAHNSLLRWDTASLKWEVFDGQINLTEENSSDFIVIVDDSDTAVWDGSAVIGTIYGLIPRRRISITFNGKTVSFETCNCE